MKLEIGKCTFEADFSNLENTIAKSIPDKISRYLQKKKEMRLIRLSMKNLYKECFTGLPKKRKYWKTYDLPVPRTPEQIAKDLEYRKYVDEKIFAAFFQKRLDEDYIRLVL